MTPLPHPATPSPILGKIFALRTVLSRQGTIVESWRTYEGRKLGPYYRLAYYVQGQPRSIYLGRSKQRVQQIRRLLEKLQKPVIIQRVLADAQKTLRAALRKQKARWRAELAAAGLQSKGFAVRGWRHWNRKDHLVFDIPHSTIHLPLSCSHF